MLIVDSQVHIWATRGLGPHHRQWPSYSADDLLAEMDTAGVSAAIICPPFMMEPVNELAVEAASKNPNRIGVMGFFQIDKPESREVIKTWKSRPGMRGLRFVMTQPHMQTWWQDGTLDWLWPAADKAGLPVAMQAPDRMKEIGVIAERYPSLKLIIDHLGRPPGTQDDASFANLPEMLALAKFPNVAVKVSGAPSNSSATYPYRNIHEPIRRIIETFGPARSFWGTDISRMPCTYRQCVTMFTEEMPWLKGRDLELVMGRALCDWIGWPLKG